MLQRVHVIISGKVQGIFYRSFVKENAEELKLTGYVKNAPSNKVEAVFEGQQEQVETMLQRCKKGPKLAVITNMEIKKEKPTKEWKEFRIIR